jgi:hypothetical protein
MSLLDELLASRDNPKSGSHDNQKSGFVISEDLRDSFISTLMFALNETIVAVGGNLFPNFLRSRLYHEWRRIEHLELKDSSEACRNMMAIRKSVCPLEVFNRLLIYYHNISIALH